MSVQHTCTIFIYKDLKLVVDHFWSMLDSKILFLPSYDKCFNLFDRVDLN